MESIEFNWSECTGSWFAPKSPEATNSYACNLEGKDKGEEWLMLFVHFENKRNGGRGWFYRAYDNTEKVVNEGFWRSREEARVEAENWYPTYREGLQRRQ